MKILIIFLIINYVFGYNLNFKKYNSPKIITKYANDNYKLVPFFATPIIKKYNLNYDDANDLKQCGYIGLMYASRKFNESYGLKFSTYSKFWIKKYMDDYLKTKFKKRTLSEIYLNKIKCYDYQKEISLDKLNDNEKNLIKDRYYYKIPVKTMAIKYNISRNTVTNKIKKIISKLKIYNSM